MLVDTTDPTEAALHAAVLAEPWNDVPRLMLADYLDETAGSVECEKCGGWGAVATSPRASAYQLSSICGLCSGSGSGTVSDGRAEQAAFIRVQVELANFDWECRGGHFCSLAVPCPGCRHHDALRKRERELWANPRLPVDEVPRNWGLQLVGDDVTGDYLPGYLFVSRGFVSEIRTTQQAFFGGGVCGRCEGRGEVFSHTVRYGSIGPRTTRIVCPTCHGSGRVAGVAKRLFEAHPIERVVLVDRGSQTTTVRSPDWGGRAATLGCLVQCY